MLQTRDLTLHYGQSQILYGGDDLSSETWDSRHRNHHASAREKLFWIAAEACLNL